MPRPTRIGKKELKKMWELRFVKKWSLPRIGRFFGYKEHSTVIHHLNKFKSEAQLIKEKAEWRKKHKRIKEIFPRGRPEIIKVILTRKLPDEVFAPKGITTYQQYLEHEKNKNGLEGYLKNHAKK